LRPLLILMDLMPFRIEDEAKKMSAQFTPKPAFQPDAVHDGNLITGQQYSGGEVANEVSCHLISGKWMEIHH